MYNPIATYRLQFHKGFTFSNFESIRNYLERLGVKTVYASPIFEAVPGSNHGYDGINAHKINPEIGSLDELRQLSQKLKGAGIGWLQDIVPNHMAFHPGNSWLMDVLEKGRLSKFASFFDINRESAVYDGKVMVPFLGSSIEEVIAKGELKIDYTDRLVFKYFESTYPLNRESYARIINCNAPPAIKAVEGLLQQLPLLHQIEDPETYAQEWQEFLLQLAGLMKDPKAGQYLRNCLVGVNSDPTVLTELARLQEYRLCYWAETDRQINYRRFFTVNSLICLNEQDPEVFSGYHKFIAELVDTGIFHGLRIDHVDGLYDPANYLEQLRDLVGPETYITVEKILEQGEKLDASWPIEGSTGYDFLAMVNNLFTCKSNEASFSQYYQKLVDDHAEIQEQIYAKKKAILEQHMSGELENLVNLLFSLGLVDPAADFSREALREAIGIFLVRCPVYRFYGNRYPLPAEERAKVKKVLSEVRQVSSEQAAHLLDTILCSDSREEVYGARVLAFYQRLMQFSGPLMAKGVEDTLMYTYNRFIGHNEVGDSPEAFGVTTEEFHQLMLERQQTAPLSLNATSTHDTKRGEDVRARLNVLTDLGEEWFQKVEEWRHLNAEIKKGPGPDANDEYFIYQSLVGAFPMPGSSDDKFSERLQNYLEKSLREAKIHSNWSSPDTVYENATKEFANSLLNRRGPFWESFEAFHNKVSDFGTLNSLAQLLLKFTCPGIPDVYQGCEHWDLSFVDPDNRRPVNYDQHKQWLDEIQGNPGIKQLWDSRFDGRIKLWLTHQLFRLRNDHHTLFTQGGYIPLQVEGKYKRNVFAFARRYKDEMLLVAVPIHLATVTGNLSKPLDWEDTRLILPVGVPAKWKNVFTSQHKKISSDKELLLNEQFGALPLLLMQSIKKERAAGVLLSITSLPSAFGIGDLGHEAYRFADFLAGSGQRYWQLLPLNPTLKSQMYSPYSSVSSMAGNTMLLSPEWLEQQGYLHKGRSAAYLLPNEGKVDYEGAAKIRKALFDEVWNAFTSGKFPRADRPYRQFCCQEDYWLHDHALYVVLKRILREAWMDWPDDLKSRDVQSLENFAKEHAQEVAKEKFLQFLFNEQWATLKSYCNQRGVEIVGDLPFYVSYDSSDVWANQEIFALDAEGKMSAVAGVPPDYFNEQGQLWGMPVFRWEVLKKQNYRWWVRRILKNLEFYDLIRLDHFRAFSAYWEVPAGSETAKGGSWKQGPGTDFFKALQQELGELPFLAEDLGDIDEPVYQLRDEFHLPGMKVLQFAYGSDHPESLNAPHNFTRNFFVYTGTHDNNTTVGWFKTESTPENRRNLERSTGLEPDERNVHLVLSRVAQASVARTAILPIQDILGLDETARINTPAETENNWLWRLKPGQLTPGIGKLLNEWRETFNR